MLRGISDLLTPDLLKMLMEMGHGDEIVLADANYPAASHACKLVCCPGILISDLLSAILELFPLDQYISKSALLMLVVPGDNTVPVVWDEYKRIIDQQPDIQGDPVGFIERDKFYQRTKSAYAIVATGDKSLYGSIILRKGIL